jgi:hypothetical protein
VRSSVGSTAIQHLAYARAPHPVLRSFAAFGAVEDAHQAEGRDARLCTLLTWRAEWVLHVPDAVEPATGCTRAREPPARRRQEEQRQGRHARGAGKACGHGLTARAQGGWWQLLHVEMRMSPCLRDVHIQMCMAEDMHVGHQPSDLPLERNRAACLVQRWRGEHALLGHELLPRDLPRHEGMGG